jgi:hypothetical protein
MRSPWSRPAAPPEVIGRWPWPGGEEIDDGIHIDVKAGSPGPDETAGPRRRRRTGLARQREQELGRQGARLAAELSVSGTRQIHEERDTVIRLGGEPAGQSVLVEQSDLGGDLLEPVVAVLELAAADRSGCLVSQKASHIPRIGDG